MGVILTTYWDDPPSRDGDVVDLLFLFRVQNHGKEWKKMCVLKQAMFCFKASCRNPSWNGPMSDLLISIFWGNLGCNYNSLKVFTPPKFYIAPEKWWLEDYFPIGFWCLFRGELLDFGRVTFLRLGPKVCRLLWRKYNKPLMVRWSCGKFFIMQLEQRFFQTPGWNPGWLGSGIRKFSLCFIIPINKWVVFHPLNTAKNPRFWLVLRTPLRFA